MSARSFLLAFSLLLAGSFLTTSTAILAPDTSPAGISEAQARPAKKAKQKAKKKKKWKGKKGQAEEPPPPPPDTDGDGIIDADDKCPEEAEDQDAWDDEDGCPDLDNDGDGIADDADQCPDEAENMDGWTDEDGCPEPAPKLKPMKIDGTLQDGTTFSGKLIRIVAVDEDNLASEPFEPEQFEMSVGDAELVTTWDKLRSLKTDKVKFSESVDCYSEGARELEGPTVWECTLKQPTVVKLSEYEQKGTHRFLDRKMMRLDFSIDELECDGASCDALKAKQGGSYYFYKMIAITENEDETAAAMELQTRLKEMHKTQLKSATFSLIE